MRLISHPQPTGRMRLRSSIPASVLAVAVGCAGNQRPAPALLPAPLVTALITDRGQVARPSPAYAVGTLPAGYPASLVPTGPVTIVGGMKAGGEVVAVFADSTRRLAAVLEELFTQAGFRRPDPTPASGFWGGWGPYTFSCRDSVMVSVEPLTGAERNFARVNVRTMRGYNPCKQFGEPPRRDQLTLPALTPPPGVHMSRSGGGYGGAGVRSHGEMTGTARVPLALLSHYAPHLHAPGWPAAAPAVRERLAAQLFQAKDASGAPWEGVLMAVGGGTAMTLSLTMNLHTRP